MLPTPLEKLRDFRDFRDLERQMGNLWNEFPQIDRTRLGLAAFNPAVNTREDESSYTIEVDLPGVDKDAVNIDISGNTLNISGERQEESSSEDKGYLRKESYFGKFHRSFTLPPEADLEQVQATCKEGVLEITIPKRALDSPSARKQIPVQ
ncbi:Hsp20/alpha crystallin family protein [Desulfurispira natronophila]|uniref:HSP20 family protein n=1 Tax=Desulfurispira natronophila TaxID=682562 RepID=A0A7W7Y271_9BACT|nr:Hsp20/alpha crystallin family protein [Desulfurispira natronophila]MBB5020698.1 HSP20 family protein [Desulfurispira natronophila]